MSCMESKILPFTGLVRAPSLYRISADWSASQSRSSLGALRYPLDVGSQDREAVVASGGCPYVDFK